MKIRILQDHTDFMSRMIEHAMDDPQGRPLSIEVLERMRAASVGAKYGGATRTAAQLKDLARVADGKEKRRLAIVLADAVELELESWFCIANPDDVAKLQVGPVLKWNGAAWWGKLKGVECPVDLEFDVGYVKRKAGRNGGGSGPAAQPERGPSAVVGAALLGMVGRRTG